MNITFYLYRLKIERSEQRDLYEDTNSTASEIICAAIQEKPSKEIRKGNTWHIGNIEQIGETGLFFAFGRVTKSIVEKYDEEAGNFLDEPQRQAPYTYVIFDLENQVCAVAHKSKIAPKVSDIANNLAKLLNETNKAKGSNLKFVMAEIKDPHEFLEYVRNAWEIKRFDIEFGQPNPMDVEQDFQKPMQKLLGKTGGSKGKTTIQGENLEKDPIEKLAAAAAATGNSASARLKQEKDSKYVTKKLDGNPATLATNEIATQGEKVTLLSKIITKYQSIRNAGEQ